MRPRHRRIRDGHKPLAAVTARPRRSDGSLAECGAGGEAWSSHKPRKLRILTLIRPGNPTFNHFHFSLSRGLPEIEVRLTFR